MRKLKSADVIKTRGNHPSHGVSITTEGNILDGTLERID